MTTESCGLCGPRTKGCDKHCMPSIISSCTGQGTCSPGATDYQPGLSCDAGGRQRTCDNMCQWGNYGNCIEFDGGGGNPLALDIPITVATTATSKIITLKTPAIARLNPSTSTNGSCTIDSTLTVYEYLEIHNPTGHTATVSVWTSGATSGTFDTLAAIYPGATIPPASRLMCTLFNDDCSTSPCVGSLMSGFVGTSRPVIAPGQSVTIYVGAYSSSTVSRDVKVNARTDVLQ